MPERAAIRWAEQGHDPDLVVHWYPAPPAGGARAAAKRHSRSLRNADRYVCSIVGDRAPARRFDGMTGTGINQEASDV